LAGFEVSTEEMSDLAVSVSRSPSARASNAADHRRIVADKPLADGLSCQADGDQQHDRGVGG
jgi:hypothetical protein